MRQIERRAKVAHLLAQNPNLSTRAIADQLGVGKDTVRRDITALGATPAPDAPAHAPHAPQNSPTLALELDDDMRQALATLRATRDLPDTPAQNVAAARAAIRAMADEIRETAAHPAHT